MKKGQTAVTNAVNLSFFMVNLSHYLLLQASKEFHFSDDLNASGNFLYGYYE
jgi:hypothetical protein